VLTIYGKDFTVFIFILLNQTENNFLCYVIKSMKQSPFIEDNNHSSNQEITRILWKLKVITMLTKASHLFLSWSRRIQSTISHPVSL